MSETQSLYENIAVSSTARETKNTFISPLQNMPSASDRCDKKESQLNKSTRTKVATLQYSVSAPNLKQYVDNDKCCSRQKSNFANTHHIATPRPSCDRVRRRRSASSTLHSTAQLNIGNAKLTEECHDFYHGQQQSNNGISQSPLRNDSTDPDKKQFLRVVSSSSSNASSKIYNNCDSAALNNKSIDTTNVNTIRPFYYLLQRKYMSPGGGEEHSDILGLYTSRAEAKKAAQKYCQSDTSSDTSNHLKLDSDNFANNFCVTEMRLGDAAQRQK